MRKSSPATGGSGCFLHCEGQPADGLCLLYRQTPGWSVISLASTTLISGEHIAESKLACAFVRLAPMGACRLKRLTHTANPCASAGPTTRRSDESWLFPNLKSIF